MNQIRGLSRVFAYLWLLTVGGSMAAFPQMKVLTVDVHKWLAGEVAVARRSVKRSATTERDTPTTRARPSTVQALAGDPCSYAGGSSK